MARPRRDAMVVAAARLLTGNERVLVGVGVPNVAANLAKRLHAPDLVLIYESGVIDARPERLPLSIGDATLVEHALAVLPMAELFFHYLATGWIDVGFLGAAQMDRYGNLNSTVIGDYGSPRVRLSGAGGAPEIASGARRTIIVMEHRRDRLPAQIDFITTVGHSPGHRRADGRGPWRVVTDLGVFGFDLAGELQLMALLPGHTYEEVLDHSGWRIPLASDSVSTIAPVTEEEWAALEALQHSLKGAI